MMIRAAKMTLVFGCVLCLGIGSASTAHAGPFSDAIFGPSNSLRVTPAGYSSTSYTTTSLYGPSADGACCGGSTYGMYAPSYSSWSSSYAPTGGFWNVGYTPFWSRRCCRRACCAARCGYGGGCGGGCGTTLAMGCSSCSPCGSGGCGTGGCGLSGCATGECGVSSGVTPMTPVPDQGPNPTYAPGQNRDGEFNRSEEFQPRQDRGGSYGPDGAKGPAPAPENTNPPSAIQKREPAPTPEDPSADGSEGLRGPALNPLNLDGKVTWRPTITRERTEVSSSYSSIRVARRPLYAKSSWVAPEGVDVAKK